MDNSLSIVCYTGGTCGDLITALIDPTDVVFRNNAIVHSPDRIRLKRPDLFDSDIDKSLYIDQVSEKYSSIPSHDLAYHIACDHSFVSIVVEDFSTALWAAQRFKKLHRSESWTRMTDSCGASSVEDYAQILVDYGQLVSNYTDKIIKLESIVQGHAIQQLGKIDLPVSDQGRAIYKAWLEKQHDN